MCGIAGYFGNDKISKNLFYKASKHLRLRGPDDTSFFFNYKNNLFTGLIHTRLSIIDLNKRSNQPFHFKNYVMVFNGEIYNYKELKKILISKGYKFKTDSDTEVLIKSFDYWKENSFNKFEGMWALAIYDKKKNEIIFSRDCFGEKPIYYYKYEKGFFFASNINCLLELIGEKKKFNYEHIKRYLVNGYKSLYKKDETFFLDIKDFPKNSIFSIDNSFKLKKKIIWKPNIKVNNKIKYEQAVDDIKEILINSVKHKMRSDVKLAFCLSGGVDSNSLIGIANKVFNKEINAFSIISDDPRFEENKMIDIAIQSQNLNCHKIHLKKKNFLENLEQQIILAGRPIYTISYYLHNILMKEIAKRGYKVSISGTGADEIFTGYYDHYNLYAFQNRNNKIYKKKINDFWKKEIKKYVRNPFLRNLKLFYNNRKFRDHIYLNNKLFSSYLKDGWLEGFEEKFFSSDILKNRMLNELFYEAVPVILSEDDNNSMNYSVENRSPFLDINLLNYTLNLPSKFYMHKGFSKSLLRDSMKNFVDDRILYNTRKVGFNASINENLHLKKNKDYILSGDKIFELVKKEKIEKLIKKKELLNSESKFLFNFINSKIFLEKFK